MAFNSGFLYAILFYRGDNCTWHWGFFLAAQTSQTLTSIGTLYHCKNDPNTRRWEYQMRPQYNPGATHTGIVLITQLANLRGLGDFASVGDLLHSHFYRVQVHQNAQPGAFSCKTWFFDALRALENGAVVTCANVDDVEKELYLTALQLTPTFVQTRRHTVKISRYCTE
ncbi:hypothetical protein DFH11DRAFT_1791562 [Phellopilus nigrolimitatus]|nr:hypothetical protein DFH11DRAFT_1791562 [Phellopilus nigrolimitatus]